MKNRSRYVLSVFVILAITIFVDQGTKKWAQNSMKKQPPIAYMNDFFVLDYAENDGAFLSWGSDMNKTMRTIVLTILPIAMISYLLYFIFFNKEISRFQGISLAFILGGGISNIFDRAMFGWVVDFMNMGIGNLRTGIFNFADVFIMAGIGMFIVSSFWNNKKVGEEETVVNE